MGRHLREQVTTRNNPTTGGYVMEHEIEWKNPPPRRRGGGDGGGWRPSIVARLQARPGMWARVEVGASTGSVSSWKRLGVEAVTRDNRTVDEKPVCDVYARWVGDAS